MIFYLFLEEKLLLHFELYKIDNINIVLNCIYSTVNINIVLKIIQMSTFLQFTTYYFLIE